METLRTASSHPAIAALALFALAGCGAPEHEYPEPVEPGPGQVFAPESLMWTSTLHPGLVPSGRETGELHPALLGTSLFAIVSSRRVVRSDGRRCSWCHYEDGPEAYRPAIERDAQDPIDPRRLIDGKSWAQPGGWAQRFIELDEDSNHPKPAFLRELLAAWIGDGAEYKAPLRWDSTIKLQNLGEEPGELLEGRSIEEIVNSRAIVREDGKLCGSCHFPGGNDAYRPPMMRDPDVWIGPDDLVDGRTWAEADGWAERFIAQGPGTAGAKPDLLRTAFQTWLADGALR